MRKHHSLKRSVLVVAVALSLCAMASPSHAGAIWGGGRRVVAESRDGRAGWRAGWRLVDIIAVLRAGW